MNTLLNRTISLAILAASAATLSPAALAHGDPEQAKSAHAAARSDDETAFGQPGDSAQVTRTVVIDMHDTMRFSPANLTVQQGDTIKFVIRNKGRVMHEMVLGTREDLDKHAAMMRQHPGMEHDEPYMSHVTPGKEQELVWQFTHAGDFQFACLIPGHFESGMTGTIKVSAK